MQAKTNSGRGVGNTAEVKKKRSEDSSETILKKPKQDTSTASSAKVKITNKMTLQKESKLREHKVETHFPFVQC